MSINYQQTYNFSVEVGPSWYLYSQDVGQLLEAQPLHSVHFFIASLTEVRVVTWEHLNCFEI